jgi:hypothetical protein
MMRRWVVVILVVLLILGVVAGVYLGHGSGGHPDITHLPPG